MATVVQTHTPARLPVLQIGETLVVTAAALSNGRVGRLADGVGATVPDNPLSFISVGAGSTVRIGPFSVRTRHVVESLAGTLTVSVDPPVMPIPVGGDAADVIELFGAGAPSATTGANVAGPGSRYTDTAGAKLYLNTGTKASPTWTQLAFAS